MTANFARYIYTSCATMYTRRSIEIAHAWPREQFGDGSRAIPGYYRGECRAARVLFEGARKVYISI